MEKLPFVSVIVPAHNSEATIEKCIESLLNQEYPKDKYEIIIVDNKSRDRTAKIVKSFPVHYAEEKEIRSAYAARNRGIKQAKGQILAFVDSDCAASRDWLIKGVEGFENVHVGCVGGGIRGGDKPATYVEKYLCKKNIISQEEKPKDLPFPYAKTANAFYRKDVFNKIGLFEEKWISGGDADLSWRMQLETDYKIKFSSDAVVFHKHRETVFSMFKQCEKWGIGYTLLYKKYRERMPKRTCKQTIWILQRLVRVFFQMPIFIFYKDKMSKEIKEKYLDHISFMGWEVGRILGSITNRVFYI